VILPKRNEIFTDWDSRGAMEFGLKQLRMLQIRGHAEGWRIHIYRSRTRGHYHGVFTTPRDMDYKERITYACILGSDLTRELMNYARVEAGAPWPILFIEKGKA
jgi:hypothetical protein